MVMHEEYEEESIGSEEAEAVVEPPEVQVVRITARGVRVLDIDGELHGYGAECIVTKKGAERLMSRGEAEEA